MRIMKQSLPEVTKQSSEMERRADEAERETIKLKKAEYMEEHIGEDFDGVISGVTKLGYVCRTAEYDRGTGACCKYDR